MKKLLRVCATGALLLGASLAAQAQGPGDATLVASDCTNLQLLRNGQSLNAVIGTQLVGDDQLTCISEGSFAVRYPNCELEDLQQHTVSAAACQAAAPLAGVPTSTQAALGFVGAVVISSAIAAGNNGDGNENVFFTAAPPPAGSPAINQ